MANRLHLNFNLETIEERKKFLETYLDKEDFQKFPLTQKELGVISDYLLWGKSSDGRPVGQDLNLCSKDGTWNKEKKIESLEHLTEQINFNENSIRRLGDLSVKPKVRKESFSREKARIEAPPLIRQSLEELWRQIDETDLIVNFYELEHNRRKIPVRESLLEKFSEKERKNFLEISRGLSGYDYLKRKRLLVELRREQFTYRDSYHNQINSGINLYSFPFEKEPVKEIQFPKIFPFGGKTKDDFGELLFSKGLPEEKKKRSKADEARQQELIAKISKLYWEEKDLRAAATKKELDFLFFDFRRLEDVYQLLQFYSEIQDQDFKNLEESSLRSELGELLAALQFYIELAELTEPQSIILERKIHKFSNEEIRQEINTRFHKSYMTNYISTIYQQKIIKKINEAATFHEKIVENLPYPENFKKCSCCGRVFLIDSRNFVRKRTSKDGFNPRCKFCDRVKREERKLKKLKTLEQ